ncbi:hypothetical protein GGR32_000377 [Mesonia hippocampi]|uniref:Membrane protein YfhO n=1 Tax=Mesonia hippocampi TaxID=1628250 RepID=A0A840ELW0_9FLAO|nr:YfhO family protein [Mesonia hippocampi]MBB4118105.1 hypothetical protein [Mesonia hippocampi]
MNFKKLLPHGLVLLGFIVISLAYFHPVLSGKVIFQSDIAQYVGMAKQQNDFRQATGEEPYWTDAAFGGMPTYQLGANYPYNYIKKLDRGLRFLPRPADYLFLYFIGLYIFLLCLKIDYKLAAIGALAFGFSTYLIIILGVGHNAKAHAIAYMPWVLGGIVLCFRQRYLLGAILLCLGMALEINANHFQMTYYLLLLVLVMGVAYFYDFYKKKKLPQFFKAIGIMLVAVLIAVGTNATNLLATKEYSDFSTRGDTGLSIDPDGNEKEKLSGLSYEYITEYSYGILESLNVFIPRFMGGSSAENLGKDSEVYKAVIQLGASPQQAEYFSSRAATYWGNQTYIGAPAYIGAGVIFLMIFALYLIKGRLKWWLVGGSLLALILSWGSNLAFVTKFFINYVPLYDKFRAVSSIQVIMELCFPVLAIVGLSKLFAKDISEKTKLHALKWSSIIVGGISISFLLLKSMLFDFTGSSDAAMIDQLGVDFVRALREDRKNIFTTDTLRSLIFVLLIAGVIWAYLTKKLQQNTGIALIGLLLVVDLVNVDWRYVNTEDFVNKHEMERPFIATQADKEVLKDTTHYRVLDITDSPLNSARASFFHNSLGGYHAAKPGRMQELFDFHVYNGNQQVLNMLHVKYILMEDREKRESIAEPNPDTNGNAWFVNELQTVESPNEEILALNKINTKTTAVITKEYATKLPQKDFKTDTTASIKLVSYQPNKLIYTYEAKEDQLAVFSEMYYPHGWKATIDNGESVNIFPVNYVLRAAVLPAGNHNISFSFEPEVITTGSMITLISLGLLLILLAIGIWQFIKNKHAQKVTH